MTGADAKRPEGRAAATPFGDRFSGHARHYASVRPRYPKALFDYLASLAPERGLAWDCGTGNGQAARSLASRFDRVVATDASAEQIAHAPAHRHIEYRVARAQDVSFGAGTVDLVTAAAAVHWFDLDAFYATVRRAARPGGILAVWTYHFPVIEPDVDRVLAHYYWKVLDGFWPESFRWVEDHYRSLPFPFPERETPSFSIRAVWDLARFDRFVDSWSATQAYLRERGENPLDRIRTELEAAWGGAGRRRTIRWPLYLRVGTIGANPGSPASPSPGGVR